MAFPWQADDGPLIVVWGSSLPSSTKNNVVKVGPPLTNLLDQHMNHKMSFLRNTYHLFTIFTRATNKQEEQFGPGLLTCLWLCMLGKFTYIFVVCCCFFFQNQLFWNSLSDIPSVSNCLDQDKAWYIFWPIRIQTVCKGCQQNTKVVPSRQSWTDNIFVVYD